MEAARHTAPFVYNRLMLRYALPRLWDFVFILFVIGALFSGARMLNADSDVGRHLALGNYILANHQIPTLDILSYTKAGEPRPPYEWLAEVAFALAFRLLNLDGVVLLTALLIAAAFTLVYVDAAHRSKAPIIALFISVWAAAASSLHWVSRPHLFSFVFLALWLGMLERVRMGEKQPMWQFPALMMVWANTHGGFLFGFLTYAAYLGGWLLELLRHSAEWHTGRRLLLIGGTSLVTSMLTPDLWGNWVATLNNRSSFVLGHTVETMPLNLSGINSWPFLGLLVLTIALMILRWKALAPAHAILLAGLAFSGFAMARNVPLFAIAAAPLCTCWLAQSLGGVRSWTRVEEAFSAIDRGLRGFLWSGLAVVVACAVFWSHLRSTQTTVFQWNPGVLPLGAVAWLEEHPQPGHVFNDINWGGYLLFRMWPGQRVFIDSQTDFYGEPFVREYAALLEAPSGWDVMLQKYNVNTLLLPPSTPLALAAQQSTGWRVVYQDATAIIVGRR